MQNLLNYTITPLRYEVTVERARLDIAQTPMRAQIRQTQGSFNIRQQHVKVQMDSTAQRADLGYKTNEAFSKEAASLGYQAFMEQTAQYSEFGDSIKNIQKGATIPDALYNQMMQRAQGELVIVPLSPTDISWIPGSAESTYNPAEVDIQWNVAEQGTELEFVPGSIKFDIVQYPSISFEYVGPPIYVPPSSAPDYEG